MLHTVTTLLIYVPCPGRLNTFAQALHTDIDRDGDRAELNAADSQFVERSKSNWERNAQGLMPKC